MGASAGVAQRRELPARQQPASPCGARTGSTGAHRPPQPRAPVTRQPVRCAARMAKEPQPQPTSSTWSPSECAQTVGGGLTGERQAGQAGPGQARRAGGAAGGATSPARSSTHARLCTRMLTLHACLYTHVLTPTGTSLHPAHPPTLDLRPVDQGVELVQLALVQVAACGDGRHARRGGRSHEAGQHERAARGGAGLDGRRGLLRPRALGPDAAGEATQGCRRPAVFGAARHAAAQRSAAWRSAGAPWAQMPQE